uniref:Uncharacterized protein n=1 Tax=Eutreptiella gymnastica TaxID=73025 RepID=A0A7S1JCM2_9EUGL
MAAMALFVILLSLAPLGDTATIQYSYYGSANCGTTGNSGTSAGSGTTTPACSSSEQAAVTTPGATTPANSYVKIDCVNGANQYTTGCDSTCGTCTGTATAMTLNQCYNTPGAYVGTGGSGQSTESYKLVSSDCGAAASPSPSPLPSPTTSGSSTTTGSTTTTTTTTGTTSTTTGGQSPSPTSGSTSWGSSVTLTTLATAVVSLWCISV